MLRTAVESVAHDLREFGEPETAEWVEACSDDDFVRVCSVAKWLLFHGPGTSSGASMQIGKACALAAVYVREGSPRNLTRQRRTKVPGRPTADGRFVNQQLQARAPRDYGVGQDARDFWQRDPATAVDG